MTKRLNRKELYDLVWSEPMKILSTRFGISDVALKKACARVGIPTPDRGYWAKKDAGKEVFNAAFPLRPPGMSEEIEIGAGGNPSYGYRTEEDLLAPIGAPPEFSEPIEAVRARIAETLGHITIPHKVLTWHPAIERLLKEDEKRREKELTDRYVMSWEKPVFDSPFERRRLRILNSLFFAVGKMNGRPSIRGREARDIGISFFQQHLQLALDKPKRPSRRSQVSNAAEESSDTRLCLSILKGWGSEEILATWPDDDVQKLEARITDISIQLILTAEIKYRENVLHGYQWRIKRKAELEEERRTRKLESERAEKERQKRIEQARVNRLLKDAAAFQQAGEIRKYVLAARGARI
jgi:hypothetical protein